MPKKIINQFWNRVLKSVEFGFAKQPYLCRKKIQAYVSDLEDTLIKNTVNITVHCQ